MLPGPGSCLLLGGAHGVCSLSHVLGKDSAKGSEHGIQSMGFIVSGFTLSVIPFSFLLPLHGLNLRGLEFGLRMMEGRRFSCFLGRQSSMPGSCIT